MSHYYFDFSSNQAKQVGIILCFCVVSEPEFSFTKFLEFYNVKTFPKFYRVETFIKFV